MELIKGVAYDTWISVLGCMTYMNVWWLRSESFAKLNVLKKKKKKMFDNAIPRSTRSVTDWTIKIFHEWQATRGNKNCLEEQAGFKFDRNTGLRVSKLFGK